MFQSSSLVASHLSSLANGGLLKLQQSFGLLAGAAVGGTLLPQLLALDLGALAAPLLLVGTALLLLRARANLKPWAWIFLGAGLILVGWNLLTESAELASLSEALRGQVFLEKTIKTDGFLPFVLCFASYFAAGAGVGFLVRTSNLVVVFAMLLCMTDVLIPAAALALILGGNLGAAAMVFLTTLRKRREARRLALGGFALQLIGCAVTVSLALIPLRGQPLCLWVIDRLAAGELVPLGTNPAQHLAAAHTFHNLLAGLLLLVYPKLHIRFTDRLIPASSLDDVKPHQLDPQLISVPALALRQAAAEIVYLTEIGRKAVTEAFDAFRYANLELSEQVVRRSETMTSIYRDVSVFLREVAENQLSRRDAGQLEVLQSAAQSQMRIGELAERLRELAGRRSEEQFEPTEEIDRDLNEMYDHVVVQFGNILSLLKQRDARTEENAARMVERLTKLSARVESYWRQRLEQSGAADSVALPLQALTYQAAFFALYRVAEHLAHVAQRMRLFAPERL
jgi:phosphate:Na+ symporter